MHLRRTPWPQNSLPGMSQEIITFALSSHVCVHSLLHFLAQNEHVTFRLSLNSTRAIASSIICYSSNCNGCHSTLAGVCLHIVCCSTSWNVCLCAVCTLVLQPQLECAAAPVGVCACVQCAARKCLKVPPTSHGIQRPPHYPPPIHCNLQYHSTFSSSLSDLHFTRGPCP